MKRRVKVSVLIMATLITLLLSVTSKLQTVDAANYVMEGNTTIVFDEGGTRELYEATYTSEGLEIKAEYYHNSAATLSYHTKFLYFTVIESGGNPTSLGNKCKTITAVHKSTEYEGDRSYTTFFVPAATIEGFAREFFGADALKSPDGVTLYMSHGFVLKRRSNSAAEWKIDNSPVYNTVEKIQGAAAWTYDTTNNFKSYFDVPIKVTTTTFNCTVKSADDKRGIVSSSAGTAKVGSTVTATAKSNEGYKFSYWTVEEGWVSGEVDLYAPRLEFFMPSTDLTLVAHFEEIPVVIPTKTPVVTPTPLPPEVTPTLIPPTPKPEPTQPPVYMPAESSKIEESFVRYYTTDAGITMQRIYNRDVSGRPDVDIGFGFLADINASTGEGSITASFHTGLTDSYSVGIDSGGNTWFFIPDGNKATYVHPNVYKGRNMNSADVRYVTEITFPSNITCNGTTYTVISIGGGTDRYKPYYRDSSGNNGSESWSHDVTNGSYNWNLYYQGNPTEQVTHGVYYTYGIAGTGYITSKGNLSMRYANGVTELWTYENSYYVYNTTLQFVSIPSTVTTIEDYAFYNCQALKKISGASGVTSIGEYAFEGASILSTAKTKISKDEYGDITSFKYFFYNGAYATGSPTANMLSWQNSVLLSDYLELPPFTSLRVINNYAFRYHKNLFDVTMPSGLVTIYNDVFADCDLNSITIPGKSTEIIGDAYGGEAAYTTLGTKGIPDTVIITVPESKAMFFGLKNEDYYIVRAGYNVTYCNNMSPSATYVSTAQTEIIKKEIKKTISGIENITDQYASGSTTYIDSVFEVMIDVEGTLWTKWDSDLYPSKSVPNLKFKNAFGIEVNSGGTGVARSTTYTYCVAVAENGTTWYYDLVAKSWNALNLPEGSSGHQLCVYETNAGISYSGDSSSSGSSSYNQTYYLYYLDSNSVLCRKKLLTKISSYGSSGANSYSLSSSYLLEFNSSPETVPMPSGVMFESFYVLPAKCGTKSYSSYSGMGGSNVRQTYTLAVAEVYAKGTDGTYYKGRDKGNGATEESQYSGNGGTTQSSGFNQTDFDTGIKSASNYSWETITAYRQVMSGGKVVVGNTSFTSNFPGIASSYLDSTYDNVNVIDSSGNLLFYTDITTTHPSNGLKSGTVSTILSGKNFVMAELVTDNYYLLTDAGGGVWAYYYENMIPPAKLFDGAEVVSVWDNSNEESFAHADGSGGTTTYYLNIVVLDSKGRYWEARTEKTVVSRYTNYGLEQSISWKNTTGYSLAGSSISSFVKGANIVSVGYEFRETLYASMFERVGYDFTSWNTKADGSGISYHPGEEILLTAPLSVYAQWEKASNRIRYAPNGGSGVMEDDVYELAIEKATLKKNIYMKKGYEFTGWNTEPDGSGTFYKDMATITVPQGTTILYAQWKSFSYIVKVAEDDIRVTPVTITDIFELDYDEEMTIPVALTDKAYTVEYDLNRRSTMSTIPYWKTETPLTDFYTKAILTFLGWQLYEETEEGYNYIGFYESGETVKNLAMQKGNALVLFPYWGGNASYVTLPVAESIGYDFIGWTIDKNENDEKNIIHAEEGSGARYKPTKNETLYAYYVPKEYEVELITDTEGAKPGEITEMQTSVIMTFDNPVPRVIPPESDRYVFLGYFTEPEGGGEQYYDEVGNGLRVWRVSDGNITALYAYMVSQVEVILDGRGATRQDQMTVTMTYEALGPDVITPEKTGYTFKGYFTEVRGGGKQYFDANGKGTNIWLEKDVKNLYACWMQNPIVLPEKGDESMPEVVPEHKIEIEVALEQSTVQLYADDNNPSTGAETDLQPYLVSDVVIDGQEKALGAIPSKENIAVRAKMGAWMLSTVLERRSGIEYVCMHVTVPYRTQHEDAEHETLIISDVQTKTIDYMIPKTWSYWIVESGGIYFPEKVAVTNSSMEDGIVEVPVRWDISEAVNKPSYQLISYGGKWNHLNWSQFDADGTPSLSIILTEEQYIISDVAGKLPDVTEHLSIICGNAAWEDKTEFTVLSDKLSVADVVLLSDERKADGNGAVPDALAIEAVEKKITETTYFQTYQSGIPLLATAKNGRYDTTAEVVYSADITNVGGKEEKRITATQTNEINIHTPVICIAQIAAGHEGDYQCDEIPQGSTVLVLDEEGIYSDFTLQISNTGYHSNKMGYGTRSYAMYLAQEDGKEQNQVRFPFAVWVDVGNDRENENDILWTEGTWYTVGMEKQRFYVPFWIREGEYEIELRSVAVNAQDATEKVEKVRNTQWENHVATETINVYLTGRLYEFMVYDIWGTTAWEDVREENISYTVGVTQTYGENGETRDVWDTLPLRTGVHPHYKNAGGLPIGGNFSFRLKSVGSILEDDTVISIVPELVCLTEQGYEEVDVYFEKETEQGTFLTKWSEEECAFSLFAESDSQSDTKCMENLKSTTGGREAIESYGEEIGEAVRYWSGTFSLPDTIYVAEQGSDVLGYQKKYGLSFTEDFWLSKEMLMLRFDIRLKHAEGETLYYGKIPEYIRNNIWCREAGAEPRTDVKGDIYPIYGGEVAVIYPGESGKKDYVTHGIY